MNYPLISEYEREIKTKGSVILKLPQHYDFVPNKIKPIVMDQVQWLGYLRWREWGNNMP